ncbi:MAG: hypothetical protein IPL88_14625 [Rhizobiales bacterium]|nr:hypothetical protein [Hyphomicrobiales bacterium]
MLNDLFSIERAFLANGDPIGAAHADVKDMAKGPAFRLRLDSDARLAAVELIEDAGRGAVWTLRDGQHNGFPGLKTKAGLLEIGAAELEAHDQVWKKHKAGAERRAELKRLAQAFPVQAANWPEAGHRKRIAERLDALRALANDDKAAAVPAAFERFLRAVDAPAPLLAQLTAKLIEALDSRSDEWLEPIRAAFIGTMAVVIDVASGAFARDASDPRQIGAVSAALSETSGAAAQTGVCALSGAEVVLHRGNYPQPTLPGLGQSYVYSRNADIPALRRYGRIAETSFSVGAELTRRLRGVLDELTKSDKEGKTWRLIPAESGDKPDLILCSLASLSDEDRAVLAELAEDEHDEAGPAARDELIKQGGALFGRLAGAGNTRKGETPHILVLVLRTVDPANRKAIYSRRLAADQIEDAAVRWREANRNLPESLGFFLPVKGQKTLRLHRPPRVAPLSLTPLTRALFANGGQRRVEIIGLGAVEAMGLFLGEGNAEARARKILRAFLRRCDALLLNLAAASHEGGEALRKFDPQLDLRRHALRVVGWFGALLVFLGRPKETYMNDLAYRLGQFLSGADFLHIGYCADRRNGEVPPMLVGASVMTLAGGDPVRALAVLSQRLKPYRDWMRSSRFEKLNERIKQLNAAKKENLAIAIRVGLTRARQMEAAADDLTELLQPYKTKEKRPDDRFKAELLLGYLAGFPKARKSGAPDANGDDPKIVEHDLGEAE